VQVFAGTHTLARSGNFAYGLRVRAHPGKGIDDGFSDLVVWA
jgi:hypothetical protein